MSRSRYKSRALTRERERRLARAEAADRRVSITPVPHREDGLTDDQRRRQAASMCGWCAGPIAVKSRGRIPKWCSAACRQRAWEQSRAAASGRSAIEVVERIVEIPVRPIPGVEVARHPRHREWVPLLDELATQISARGLVYDRDLDAIGNAVRAVTTALQHRRRERRG